MNKYNTKANGGIYCRIIGCVMRIEIVNQLFMANMI